MKYDVEHKVITQLMVVPQANGNVSVLKHMHFPDVKLSQAQIEGHAMTFRMGFQWFLEQLGLWQCRHYALSHVTTQPWGGFFMATLPEDAVDRGFACIFIAEKAGRLGSQWKRIQWMTKNLQTNQDSAIHQ